jgi:hypothetical protein
MPTGTSRTTSPSTPTWEKPSSCWPAWRALPSTSCRLTSEAVARSTYCVLCWVHVVFDAVCCCLMLLLLLPMRVCLCAAFEALTLVPCTFSDTVFFICPSAHPIQHMYTYTYRGSLVIRAESKVNSRDLLNVTFKGAKLSNKDGFFGTSDPFLVISRYAAVYKKCTCMQC